MSQVNRPDLPDAEIRDAARQRAYRLRHDALARLEDGLSTWQQILELSTRPAGAPLRKLRLYDIAYISLSREGVSAQQITRRWAMFRRLVGVPDPDKVKDSSLTIAWLLNNQSAPGARLAAWCDALYPGHQQRHSRIVGFPWHTSRELRRAWSGTSP